MTNYREILRLSCLGLNKAQIAGACGCSRTTVIKVLNIAAAQGLSYPLPDGMSDKQGYKACMGLLKLADK